MLIVFLFLKLYLWFENERKNLENFGLTLPVALKKYLIEVQDILKLGNLIDSKKLYNKFDTRLCIIVMNYLLKFDRFEKCDML